MFNQIEEKPGLTVHAKLLTAFRLIQALTCLIAFACVTGGVIDYSDADRPQPFGGSLTYVIIVNVLAWIVAIGLCTFRLVYATRLGSVTILTTTLLIDTIMVVALLSGGIVGATSDHLLECVHPTKIFNLTAVSSHNCDAIYAGVTFSFIAGLSFLSTFGLGLKNLMQE